VIDNRDKLRDNLKIGFQNGLKKGWSGFLWMMKIILPISFLTAVLAWSGWLDKIDYLIAPLMGFLGLPAMAALPIIIGGLTGIYGGIAAMAVLPFTLAEMTLLANFLLICHNLIQEGVIQAQSGLNSVKATLFRIAAAVVTVYAMTFFIQTDPSMAALAGTQGASPQAFYAMVSDWGLSMLELTVKIFFIIMTILTLLEIAKSMRWILPIVKALSPLLRVLGLSEKVGILWMTAVVFGLSYGGAVIVEEARQGHISKEELEELQLSVGINHSVVEDPFLFMTFGISAFWLFVPRLITAMAATRMLTLWVSFRQKSIKPTA
jgi:Fe2+ transport system protein B